MGILQGIGLLLLSVGIPAYAAEAPMAKKNCSNTYPHNGPFYTGRPANQEVRGAGPLRVVSYNVNFATELEALLRDLREIEPLKNADIILLQEIEGERGGVWNAAQEFADHMGMYYVFAPAIVREKSGRDYGNAILSRWPITRYRKILLPESDMESCNQRIALQATLLAGKTPLEVMSVHLSVAFKDSMGREESRVRQTQPILEATLDLDPRHPVIIAGDFNTVNKTGWAGIVERFSKQRFQIGHLEKAVTFKYMGFQLDRMLVRGLCRERAGVAKEAKGSDHYPIWSELVVQGPDGQCSAKQ